MLEKHECWERHWISGKQAATRVARRIPDTVTIQEIFDECTAAHDDLLEKTPLDKSICENPDLAQCSVEVVDEAAKHRLRVKEESYKACIEEDLSLRKTALSFLSESEKRWCRTRDTEAISFQDIVRCLPLSTLLHVTTQTDAPDDVWEEGSHWLGPTRHTRSKQR